MSFGFGLARIRFIPDGQQAYRGMQGPVWAAGAFFWGVILWGAGSSQLLAQPPGKSTPNAPQSSSTTPLPFEVQDPGAGTAMKDDGGDSDDDDQDAELALNDQELRLAHTKSLQIGLGEVRPWRTLSIAMGMPLGNDGYGGLDAGWGSQIRNGIFDKKTYDMKVVFQTVGLFGRIYFHKFPNLSYEPSLSLTQWSGDISPFGVEPEDPATESLSGGFQAHGVTLGLNVVSTWFVADDVSIDWTFIGIKKSWLVDQSNTRKSSWISGVLHRVITTPQAYGLTTLAVGYWF